MELRDIVAANKALTVSLGAFLLSAFDPTAFAHEEELAMLRAGVDEAARAGTLPCTKGYDGERADPRGELETEGGKDDDGEGRQRRPVAVYTDYAYAKDLLLQLQATHPDNVRVVDDRAEASFLLLTNHIKDFLSLPPHVRVSSFPYEGGFVRKDLLPLTVRRYCYTRSPPAGPLAASDTCIDMATNTAPAWWLPCYDLSTEFHLFRADYVRRNEDGGDDNCWIVKPSQGTRAQGHTVITPAMGLADVAAAAPQLPPALLQQLRGAPPDADPTAGAAGAPSHDGDKVAQLFVRHPLLALGRKFDVRAYVFVRSFVPFEAYVHALHYARLANKEYTASSEALADSEVALTVSAYHADAAVAAKQARLTRAGLRRALTDAYPGLDYDALVTAMHGMLREVFGGLAPLVGHWPRSSAYYAVDVLFDNAANVDNDDFSRKPFATPVPKLVEINFMGDWQALKKITVMENEERRQAAAVAAAAAAAAGDAARAGDAPQCGSNSVGPERDEAMLEWVHDLVTVLATRRAPSARCLPLHTPTHTLAGGARPTHALEVQAPYSAHILAGRKTVETRAYPLPEALLGRPVLLVESAAGRDAVSGVPDTVPEAFPGLVAVGEVVFSACEEYPSAEAWEQDRPVHLVPAGSAYDWAPTPSGRRWGWRVATVGTYPAPRAVPRMSRSFRSLFLCHHDGDGDAMGGEVQER